MIFFLSNMTLILRQRKSNKKNNPQYIGNKLELNCIFESVITIHVLILNDFTSIN